MTPGPLHPVRMPRGNRTWPISSTRPLCTRRGSEPSRSERLISRRLMTRSCSVIRGRPSSVPRSGGGSPYMNRDTPWWRFSADAELLVG
jgi:hypothetical protein